MSKGLGKVQRTIINDLGRWIYGTTLKYIYDYYSYDYKKPSIARAIRTLETNQLVRRESDTTKTGAIGENREDTLHLTTKGLQLYATLNQ